MKITVVGGTISEEEQQAYIDRAIELYGDEVKELKIEAEDEFVNLSYTLKSPNPFHRLRRITGYLVSDLRSWNSAKQAEERDRVKHSI